MHHQLIDGKPIFPPRLAVSSVPAVKPLVKPVSVPTKPEVDDKKAQIEALEAQIKALQALVNSSVHVSGESK